LKGGRSSGKYVMRIAEVLAPIKPSKSIKPKPLMTLAQARIHGLAKNVERSRQQLQAERDRQRRQRDAERLRNLA
jgi:hypothetical protein